MNTPAVITTDTDDHHHHLRDTWPLHRLQALQLLGGWAALTIVWIALGKLITGPLDGGVIVRTDERVATWMVAQRTPSLNHLSAWGSLLAETTTKVAVTAILALVFLAVWRRWFESLVLAVSLVVEASAFIVVTTVVGRDRPDVAHLDNSPVGSSFPSGHTAAAAAYAAIAVIVFWHTRKVWARVLVSVVALAIPIIVALARMYRGMHYLTDTSAGAVLGAASVALTAYVLARSPEGAAVLDESQTIDDADETSLPERDWIVA